MQLSQCTRQEEIYPRQRLTIARSVILNISSLCGSFRLWKGFIVIFVHSHNVGYSLLLLIEQSIGTWYSFRTSNAVLSLLLLKYLFIVIYCIFTKGVRAKKIRTIYEYHRACWSVSQFCSCSFCVRTSGVIHFSRTNILAFENIVADCWLNRITW